MESWRPDLAFDQHTWDRLRAGLKLGQRITGTVAWVPRPGAVGIGVELGLPVGGFVDVLMLPRDETKWPARGTTTDFWIWWMDERPQIRLVPVNPAYQVEDFETYVTNAHDPRTQPG